MKSKAYKIAFKGKVEYRDAASALLSRSGDTVLVERGKPRMLVMRCPCGCGDDLVINLDKRTGPAWRLYSGRQGLTLHPSFWREGACGSHFILWHNQIFWCSGWEAEENENWNVPRTIERAVLNALPTDRYIKYDDLAEGLNLIPWDVLQACRQLVKRGVVEKRFWKAEYRRLTMQKD